MYHFVILSGGSGSRLWPKSREKLPKQFLALTNEYTMFQNTLLRIENVTKCLEKHLKSLGMMMSQYTPLNIYNGTPSLREGVPQDVKGQPLPINQLKGNLPKEDCSISNVHRCKISVICNQDHSHILERQIQEIPNVKDMNVQIICEPKGRDSAPAICIASLFGLKDDYTFILPCDHIFDNEEFSRCCIDSLKYLENSIVTFGIRPTHPETGYGYIEINQNQDTLQFIEKPNIEKATKYFKEGTYLWNAGIFIFKNKNMIQCFEKYAPDILTSCEKILENTHTHFSGFDNDNHNNNTIKLESSFSNCRAISIDYAIMENLCRETDISFHVDKKTIPYLSYWNDIGSFSSLYEQLLSQDFFNDEKEGDNVMKGDIFTFDTQNSYIDSEKGFVATIGVENMIIVNTNDALLVCHKDKSQEVKKVVDYLNKNKREEALYHTKVYRPWGYYINIEGNDNSGFKVKRIAVYPGKRLSLQSHDYRSEHWVIVKGEAKVQVGMEEILLKKDQNVYIPIKTLHRIENVGEELLEFTETQIGDYLGEDDIIRYEDDFGRR